MTTRTDHGGGIALPTCPVTIWRDTEPRDNGGRGERVIEQGTCDQPVERFNLCAKHAADKVRLGGAA